ncbi:DUF4440 domain-containing protein [Pacificimonas flava]|uniref:DUF4440 domain-containing protein n=2 Tax=Pacificimonas TaxID=1960290 RepID=A0A219B9Y4_9SPHN|nr:nuclear transport factor 2 family protein [Pacificimonas aurantium]OWV34619.1 DUF4440 domain-containing protein [Pacificimonas flava]
MLLLASCDAAGEVNDGDGAAPQAASFDEEAEKAAIIAVSDRMQAAWNVGDYEGYMQGFLNPDIVFVSRGRFQDGWQGTLDHYIRDYGRDPEKRGTLTFYEPEVWMLAPDAAQLITKFHLDRPEHPLWGINTRLMRKVDGDWVIALNHVSAVETPFEEEGGEAPEESGETES